MVSGRNGEMISRGALPDILRCSGMLRLVIAGFLLSFAAGDVAWNQWWSYEGISGPEFWGVLNPRWRLCSDGKRQSPINIDIKSLLYDPTLKHIALSGQSVSGVLQNTGSGVTVVVTDSSTSSVYVTSGPLSYTYKLRHIKFRFSGYDGLGSEHRVDNIPFPGEMQLYFYNYEIYPNLTKAERSPYGVAAISVLIQTNNTTNEAFDVFTTLLEKVRIRDLNTKCGKTLTHGKYQPIKTVRCGLQCQKHPIVIADIHEILPNATSYVTYRGSQTEPSCHETVTWIVLNRPIYITEVQLSSFYKLNKGGPLNPTTLLERNNRYTMPINKRPVRTNIYTGNECYMKRTLQYKVNDAASKH